MDEANKNGKEPRPVAAFRKMECYARGFVVKLWPGIVEISLCVCVCAHFARLIFANSTFP